MKYREGCLFPCSLRAVSYTHLDVYKSQRAYWVNTGKNEIFEEIMNAATDDIVEKLHILLQGESVIARIDQNVVYLSLIHIYIADWKPSADYIRMWSL